MTINDNLPNMKKRLLEILQKFPRAKYRHQYYDYDYNCWTLPTLLTETRIENLSNDKSVSKVKVIYPNGDTLILVP